MVNTIIKTASPAAVDVGPVDDANCRFVLAIDVGTTNIRCNVYDNYARIRGSAKRKISLLHPKPGWVEIDPESIWQMCVEIVKEALRSASLSVQQVSSIGISAQRATFVIWNRKTGKPFHNFITWQDLRADDLVEEWNKSWTMKMLRTGAKLMYLLSRKNRFLAASVLTFNTRQVVMRLLWVIENVPGVRRCIDKGNAAFGMIESWLLWKLTGGTVHATDYSCVSATAMFDPFQFEWGEWILKLLDIPQSILPDVKDTSGLFGYCDPDIFGARIPITAVVADQQAAMFGECCFRIGDVKCTMGTGSFLDVNTGSKPHASANGVYPLIGWKMGNEITYIAEGAANDTGTIIDWLKKIDLLDDTSQCNNVALSVENSGGVYFIPAFTGLQAPINDNSACAGFLGVSSVTRKEHMVRAVLESLVFRLKQLFDVMQSETNFVLKDLRVDGGVSKCNFILQLLSDLTGQLVIRPLDTDSSCLGAAFLAGLGSDVWKSKEELLKFCVSSTKFYPNGTGGQSYQEWQRAVQRCVRWDGLLDAQSDIKSLIAD